MNRMWYLSPEEVKELNGIVIEYSGGAPGSVNEANLYHVCESAKRVKGVSAVAAHYCYCLAFEAHAFTDGNKRTALEAMMAFLVLNGYAIGAANEELVGLALLVARGEKSKLEIARWVKGRLKRHPSVKLYGW